MKEIISKIFLYPLKKFREIYSTRRTLLATKILKIPYILHNNIRFNHIFFRYLRYTLNRMISKPKYVSNIKEFYSDKLDEINYTICTPKYKIAFNNQEEHFLKLVNTFEDIFRFRNLSLVEVHTHSKNISCFTIQREVFSCGFKNVKFMGKSGVVIHDGRTLVESAFNKLRFNLIKIDDNFAKIYRKMKGVYTSIMHWDWDYNYYHFLIDNLTRFYAISKIKESKIYLIVHKNYPKFYLNIIRLFLDERFKLVYIAPEEVWILEKYYFPSFCASELNTSGYIPKICLDFVKNKIFEGLGIKPTIRNKRIYISRNKAKTRRIINENELLEILRKYNFEKVYTEDLTFKEEVELFNSAEIVISPIGAGLTNIIFSENLSVIELHPPKIIIAHFFMLCKILNFKYRYVIGYYQSKNYNFRVNLNKIKKNKNCIFRMNFEEILKNLNCNFRVNLNEIEKIVKKLIKINSI